MCQRDSYVHHACIVAHNGASGTRGDDAPYKLVSTTNTVTAAFSSPVVHLLTETVSIDDSVA